jgi:hypothetical protein
LRTGFPAAVGASVAVGVGVGVGVAVGVGAGVAATVRLTTVEAETIPEVAVTVWGPLVADSMSIGSENVPLLVLVVMKLPEPATTSTALLIGMPTPEIVVEPPLVIEAGFAVIEAVWVVVGGVEVGFGVGVAAAVGLAVGTVVPTGVLLADGVVGVGPAVDVGAGVAVDVGVLAELATVKIAEADTSDVLSDVLFFFPPPFVEPPVDVPLA